MFNKTFTCPLNMLNQVFDIDTLFPINVLGQEQMRMRVYMQSEYMNKIFGNDILLDATKTGIIDIELVLTSKDSEFVKSELNAKDGFADAYMRFDY